MSEWRSPQEVLDARRDWRNRLGYNAAEVAICHMDIGLAREALGELVDRIVNDALFAFVGSAEDWNANE